MEYADIAIAILLYPGLLFSLVPGLLFAAIVERSGWAAKMGALWAATTRSREWSFERLVSPLSVVLAGVALAVLPWPWHPAALPPLGWFWSWAALEAAFLLPLLPALLAGSPPVVRAAIRAAQIGVVGRIALWLGLAVGLVLFDNWEPLNAAGHSPLAAHLLALLAAFFAFAVAIGWGPFSDETSLVPDGPEAGLDPVTIAAARGAALLRNGILLAATLVAVLPVGMLPPWAGLLAVFAGCVVGALLLGRLTGRYPRLTLPVILKRTLWRGLAVGAVATAYLSLIG